MTNEILLANVMLQATLVLQIWDITHKNSLLQYTAFSCPKVISI